MLQDIQPYQFNNEFKQKTPENTDYILLFKDDSILMDKSARQINFTSVEKINALNPNIIQSAIYLFSVDNTSFFYSFETIEENKKIKYIPMRHIRKLLPEWMVFIVATASHLANWHDANRFCGRCAAPMEFSKTERALCCPKCGLVKYPNISPAVIVGIIDNDKILLTRYSDREYKKLSLVAGFVEIGETPERAIMREVMEEVGLKVKDVKYFKSQPWAFSQSLLMGFFAQLDGSSDVKLDRTELSEAIWYKREEISPCETTMSLTNEMIEAFRKNETGRLLFA